MTKHFLALPLLAAGLSLAQPGPALAQAAPAITTSQDEIAYEEFTLPNGLRVVVHEDHSVPKVAVAVWYHVGSMNEPDGKSGYY